MAPEAVLVVLPEQADLLRTLPAGTPVEVSGVVFAARDATHVRIAEHLARTGELPFGLAGQALFYAGPTPPAAGRAAGAIGPTTAKRMDLWTPALLGAGVVATLGKGPRSEAVRRACAEHHAVYLVTVGGAAALLATHVRSLEVVAYPELGAEALARVELDRLPAWVAIDAAGRDLFAELRAGRASRTSSS